MYLALMSYVAVSYTHLRAHETVLDLVCRLLLEKKTDNKKKKKKHIKRMNHKNINTPDTIALRETIKHEH